MKILRKLAVITVAAVMCLGFSACGQSADDSKDPVVAKIGDTKITKSQLDSSMMQTDYYLQSYYGADFKENAQIIPTYNTILDQNLEQLIGYEILVMKAKDREDITVTDDEVEAQLTSTKASFSTDDDFNSALETANMTLEQLKASIEKDLYYQKMIESYQNSVEVTDAEISDYYNANVDNYTQKPGATISHILVDSEDKAKEVLQKYKDGTSFEDLAAEYGTDGTKSTGGSLGYIEYDTTQYDADFMAAAKTLGEGEVSEPVKTQFGWHLIKADGIQAENKVQALEEVTDTIKDTLNEQKANEAITADVESWKADYKIETYKEKYQLTVPEATAEASAETSAAATADNATTEASPAN